MNKKISGFVLMLGLLIPQFSLATTVQPLPLVCAGFSDVQDSDPSCEAVKFAKNAGFIQGYEDGTLKPNVVINRAETMKVILLGFGIKILSDDGTNYGFSDVTKGSWYMPYLRTAQTNQVVKGYSDGTFKPDAQVNRAEMYKIFFQTAASVGPASNQPTSGYESQGVSKEMLSADVIYPVANDVSENDWYAPYFNLAKNMGMMGPLNAPIATTYYYPQNGMTRIDLIQLFWKFNGSPKFN